MIRLLIRLALALVAITILVMAGTIAHNQYVRSRMKGFCSTLVSMDRADAMRSAQAHGAEVRPGLDPRTMTPQASRAIFSRTSLTGVRWECAVTFENGRVGRVEFRGRGGPQ